MSKRSQSCKAIENEMIRWELIEGLQRAIDRKHRRLFEAAKDQWDRNFASKDRSDSCARVRIDVAAARHRAASKVRAG